MVVLALTGSMMFGVISVVIAALVAYFVIGITKAWPSAAVRDLSKRMNESKTFLDWRRYARQLDEAQGLREWREQLEAHFPLELLESRIRMLADTRKGGDMMELLKAIRCDIHRSIFGITNPTLYRYRTATKSWISNYVNLMSHLIASVSTDTTIPAVVRHRALKDMQLAYGKSALLLNGGVALGAYHLGVVKALHEANLLPNIIFGCNTGALVAAYLCCFDDVDRVLDGEAINFSAFDKRGSTGSLKRKWNRLLHEGTLMDVGVLLQFAKDNVGELTFAEAFKKTGRVLNINIDTYLGKDKGVASWLCNHLTTPNVLVYTAAVASCATAYVYGATPLLAKTLSGSIVPFDPPALSFCEKRVASFHINDAVDRLRELFNVKLTIVSECSVTRLPFLRLEHRKSLPARLGHFVTEEVWRLLAFMSRLPLLRTRATGALQIMSHRVKGDVVIYPVTTFGDLLKLVSNPDKSLLDYCVWRGQLQVWPLLPLLKTHIAVEAAIRSGLRHIAEQTPSVLSVVEAPHTRGRRLKSICEHHRDQLLSPPSSSATPPSDSPVDTSLPTNTEA